MINTSLQLDIFMSSEGFAQSSFLPFIRHLCLFCPSEGDIILFVIFREMYKFEAVLIFSGQDIAMVMICFTFFYLSFLLGFR